ncbi:hypothetical protein H4R19_000346 [Coemansia spiralis]|nr:hypothetical protein H4R19_000346 [Coemansia spiralis]
MESGRATITVVPGTHHRAYWGISPKYVFEIKRHPRGNGDYESLMHLDSRRHIEHSVRQLAIGRDGQVRDSYWQTAMARAGKSNKIFRVSIAFWMHRMYVAMKRFQRHGQWGWAPEPYTNADVQGMSRDIFSARSVDGHIEISSVVSSAEW